MPDDALIAAMEAGSDLPESEETGSGPEVETQVDPDAPHAEGDATKEAIADLLKSDKAKGAKKEQKVAKKEPEPEPEAEGEVEGEADKAPEVETEPEPEHEAEAEADESEADKEASKELRKKEVELAANFNKLAQQERKFLKEREESRAQVETAKKEVEAAKGELASLKSAIELLERSPIRALKLLGNKSFEKIANRVIEMGKNPQLGMQDEMAMLREEQERRLKEFETRQETAKKEEHARMLQQRREIDRQESEAFLTRQVEEQGDRWAIIKSRGMEKQIAKDIYEHFEKTGEVLKYADYLDFVEEKQAAQIESALKTSKRLAKYKAVEEEEQDVEPEVEAEAEPEPEPVKRPARTLTNRAVARAAPPTVRKAPKEKTGDREMDAALEGLMARKGWL